MKHHKFIAILFLIAVAHRGYTQLDPLYTQYHFNQFLINPAFAGLYESAALSVNSRAQWYGLEGAPFTNTVTLESGIGKDAGFGLRIMNDRIGISNHTEIMAAGSYFIQSHFVKIGMGLQGGISTITNDITRLDSKVWNDPNLANFPPILTQPNFGVGLVIQRFDYFFSFSIPRILETNGVTALSDPRYKRPIYLSTGYRFSLFRSKDTKLQTLVRVIGDRVSFDLAGTYFITDFLWAGAMVRDYYGVSFFSKLGIHKNLNIGYSFELPTNNLIFTNYGTHEVTLSYLFTPFKNQNNLDRIF